MRVFTAFVGAVGLWALPAAAAPPELNQPSLSARAVECSAAERARCEGAGQRAIQSSLSCDACLPMPADLVQPPRGAEQRTTTPACLPRADGVSPDCVDVPHLDTIPRP